MKAIIPSGVENARCVAGEMQSSLTGTPLILAIDAHAERRVLGPPHVDAQVGHLRAAAADHDGRAGRGCGAARHQAHAARAGGRLERLLGHAGAQRDNRCVSGRDLAGHGHGGDPACEGQHHGGDQHRQFFPPLARLGFPGQGDAAGLEQPQRGVHALCEAELMDQLRMLAAVAFKIMRAPHRQAAGDVALGDLVAQYKFAIHRHGGRRHLGNSRGRRCGRRGGRHTGAIPGGRGRDERRGAHPRRLVPMTLT